MKKQERHQMIRSLVETRNIWLTRCGKAATG